MPFIQQDRREPLLDGTLNPAVPGDVCFLHYVTMVERWRKNPSWTTAHNIYRSVRAGDCDSVESQLAMELAWQVFFQLYVMPYEIKKREENGDI